MVSIVSTLNQLPFGENYITQAISRTIKVNKTTTLTAALTCFSNRVECEKEAGEHSTADWSRLKKIVKSRTFQREKSAEKNALDRIVEWVQLGVTTPDRKPLFRKPLSDPDGNFSSIFSQITSSTLEDPLFRLKRLSKLLTATIGSQTPEETLIHTWDLWPHPVQFFQVSKTKSTHSAVKECSTLVRRCKKLESDYKKSLIPGRGSPIQRALLTELLKTTQCAREQFKAVQQNLQSQEQEWLRVKYGLPIPPSTSTGVIQEIASAALMLFSLFLDLLSGSRSEPPLNSSQEGTPKNKIQENTFDLPAGYLPRVGEMIPHFDKAQLKPELKLALGEIKWGKSFPINGSQEFTLLYLKEPNIYLWRCKNSATSTSKWIDPHKDIHAHVSKIDSLPEQERALYLSEMQLYLDYEGDNIASVTLGYPCKWDPLRYVDEKTWSATLISVERSSGGSLGSLGGHAKLCIEGVDLGIPFVKYVDFTLMGPRIKSLEGEVPIYIHEKNQKVLPPLRKKSLTLLRDRASLESLLRNVESDIKNKTIKFGWSGVLFPTSKTEFYCLTYVIRKLRDAGIHFPFPGLLERNPDAYVQNLNPHLSNTGQRDILRTHFFPECAKIQ